MDLADSSGFIQGFEEILEKIISHPLSSPLGDALKKTSGIVDQINFVPGGNIITPIIKGALWVAVKDLHPDALDDVETDDEKGQGFSGVLNHLEKIEDQMSDVHKLAQATLSLQVDERFKSGLEQICGAYTTFLKSGSDLNEWQINFLPFQSNAFDMANTKHYLEIVKEFQGMDSVDAAFSYVIDIRAKYLLMRTKFFIFKNNPEEVVQEFHEFNKYYEEVRVIYSGINDVAAALEEAYKSGGEDAMRETMEKHLNQWRFQKVNFAVTGGTGMGKSSFINSIRGLKATDVGAADIGVKETTTDVAMYDFPENTNIKIWDLPGVGTERFPKDEYFNKIDAQLGELQNGLTFDSFDAHMVFSASRFTEMDHFIARRVNNLGKKLIYARTKVDVDIRNNEEDKDIPEQETLDSIRTDCELNLKKFNNNELFLISTKLIHREKWDFLRLYHHILDTLSNLQKEAFLFSVQVFNEEMIQKKVVVLKGRIPVANAAWWIAIVPSTVVQFPLHVVTDVLLLTCNTAGGAARAVGLDNARDFMGKTENQIREARNKVTVATIIHNEVMFQREQLAIDDKSIENLARDAGKTKQEIMEAINLTRGPRILSKISAKELATNRKLIWRHVDLYNELDFNEKSAKKKMKLLNKLHKEKM